MKYIRIANIADSVNRLHLEKLGLSTKRNDPNTIGQFGSGIKYAPISALRMGLDFVFVGSDDKGEYQLRYSSTVEDGIDCIVYNYGTYTKPSSFTVDAGTLSWDNEWQIYREVIANAKDNGHWHREIVDEIKYIPGEFAVYITASNGMMKIYDNHDKYFTENRDVVYTCNYTGVSFLKKYDRSERIYHKTVLVNTEDLENFESLFDYEIDRVDLNEERSLKHISTERIKIVKAIAGCTDKSLIEDVLLEKMIKGNLYEHNTVSEIHWTYTSPSNLWKKCFHETYGDNAVIVSPEQSLVQGFAALVKTNGKRPVICTTNAAFTFLGSACRIEKAENCIGEEHSFDIDEDISKYPKLLEAMKIASFFEPGITNLNKPIVVFEPKDGQEILGITINMSDPVNKQIMISAQLANEGSIRELISTVIHEYDHYSSGYSDSMYREFRNLADKRLGSLMYQYYKDTPVFIHKDAIKIKVMDLPLFTTLDYVIEYLPTFGWHLVRIGKLTFKLETPNTKIHKSGVCNVDETGEHFMIDIGTNGSIVRVA